MRAFLIGLTGAATLVVAGAASAQVDSNARSSSSASVAQGQTVRDSKGAVVGKVESVSRGRDGLPSQVLVRVGGVARVGSTLKALPAAGLQPKGGEAVTVLTRAELDAMPDAPR